MDKCFDNEGEFVDGGGGWDINFVKDIPLKYINFNITVIIVSDQKNMKYYFYTNLHNFH